MHGPTPGRAALGDATDRANVIGRTDAHSRDAISSTCDKPLRVEDPAPPASGGGGGGAAQMGGEQMVADSLDALEMHGGSSLPKPTMGSSGREALTEVGLAASDAAQRGEPDESWDDDDDASSVEDDSGDESQVESSDDDDDDKEEDDDDAFSYFEQPRRPDDDEREGDLLPATEEAPNAECDTAPQAPQAEAAEAEATETEATGGSSAEVGAAMEVDGEAAGSDGESSSAPLDRPGLQERLRAQVAAREKRRRRSLKRSVIGERQYVSTGRVDAIIRKLKKLGKHDTLCDKLLLPLFQKFGECLVNIAEEAAPPELINAAMIWLRLCKDPARTLAEGAAATEVRLLLILDTEAMLDRLNIGTITPKMQTELTALRAMMPTVRHATLEPHPLRVHHAPTELCAMTPCSSQLRDLLVEYGFAEQNDDGSFTAVSPLEGYSAVAVLYALLVDAVRHGKIPMRWLRADCACARIGLVAKVGSLARPARLVRHSSAQDAWERHGDGSEGAGLFERPGYSEQHQQQQHPHLTRSCLARVADSA